MTTARPLRFFDSLTRDLKDLVPLGEVGLYSCGPTVYSYPHLGNMRAYVFADTLRRVLRWRGLPVRHVVSITDVGHAVADSDTGADKLDLAAAREQRPVEQIAEHYTRAFFTDLAALHILPAHAYPRASQYVPQMIEFAIELENRGYTYRIPSGLYFDTSALTDYGALARVNACGQREGARVELVPGRRSSTDFALWRAELPGERRAMRWPSPWGWGAPGWHLECSVMAIAELGPHFAIHTGGVDHRELHHINEIAQSEAYLGDGLPWVEHWMHNEFLHLNAAKIAKSTGGGPRLADLAAVGIHPLAFRLFLLGSHYRAQASYTEEAVNAAQTTRDRLIHRALPLCPLPQIHTLQAARAELADDPVALGLLDRIDGAAADDLATPRALVVLGEVLRHAELGQDAKRRLVASCEALLGLGLQDLTLEAVDIAYQTRSPTFTDVEIEHLLAERAEARHRKNWARADYIRSLLHSHGIRIVDTAGGQSWTIDNN